MPSDLDLKGYFERIHWSGDAAPALETIKGLLIAHMRAIPFEHLDVLRGKTIALDLESLQAKLVHARRGGYCFERIARGKNRLGSGRGRGARDHLRAVRGRASRAARLWHHLNEEYQ